MSNRIHCYHSSDLNRQQATFPYSELYVCCFCGHQHTIRRVRPQGHGSYLPQGEGCMEQLPTAEDCPYVPPEGKSDDHQG